ncbi:cytochrome c oxidase assembly protein [Brevibacillus fulvus]|uniref:Membrane protein n=1 Tax=Brevibacillus fulvus TaxID=1125967 RepID=A0A939BSU0_9BACL|nr:cytochrome c oxidase assembly protein [Brevibacillus fulvus]MBM7591092.1 putative membrane protein [Brevibacillus fulvus]
MHDNHGGHLAAPSFTELWSPEIMLIAILIAVLYLAVVGSWRKQFAHSAPVSGKKKAAFLIGLLVFYLAEGSPISYYGHHFLFSAHMLQQALLYFTMPLLILVGTPDWLLRSLLQNKVVDNIWSFMTRPLIALFTFNVLFSFYHMPFIFDAAMEAHWFMTVYHIVLVITAFQMWWPIISPIAEEQQMSDLRKLAYIFGNGVLITPACALIIFADHLIYETYSNVPQVFSMLAAFDDQRLGGIIMKTVQEIVYGSVLAYTFYKWYNKEKGTDIPELDQASQESINILTPAIENKGRV